MSAAVKERPILFSAPMVNAILAGTKTMTRRLVPHLYWISDMAPGLRPYWREETARGGGPFDPKLATCPYGVPGDRLWVRETWAPMARARDTRVAYRADMVIQNQTRRDGTPSDLVPWPVDNTRGRGYAVTRWTPSIHMPRWASRIMLEVTAVRVERLHEITEQDARAEGVDHVLPQFLSLREDDDREGPEVGGRMVGDETTGFARDNFCRLWEQINGERAPWAANPWVWVVSFTRARS